MSNLSDIAIELVDSISRENDAAVIIERFSTAASHFGFNNFIMTGLPAYGEDVERLILKNAWPTAWSDRYREKKYFLSDPVSKMAFTSSRQYRWSEAREHHPSSTITRQIEAEARGIGLVDGLAFPVFDPHNWQAVVSLSSDRTLDLPDRDYALTYMMAAVAQGKVTELLRPMQKSVPDLTPREREVMTWLAAGKTQSETADILKVSHGTIKSHVEHVNRKLNTANTMQSIVRAVHSRQIIL
jgi:LuxR family quorum sensing-dependent transcriptional regulator